MALLAAACTNDADGVITLDDPSPSATGAPSDTEPPSSPPEESPQPAPDGEDPGGESPDGQSDPTVGICDDDQRDTFVGVIDGQIDAIAEREWARALAFASEQFRAEIDADRFRDIILEGFPVVADAVGRDVGVCQVAADEATIAITVEGRDGAQQQLLYLLVRAGDGWAIGGAAPADGPPAGDEPSLTV